MKRTAAIRTPQQIFAPVIFVGATILLWGGILAIVGYVVMSYLTFE